MSCLYIHIPFCVKKCSYCDFFSVPFDESLAETYIKALCTELSLRKQPDGILDTVYIGGGTPSLLSETPLRALFESLADNFILSPSAEITVEVNPGTLDENKIGLLLDFGINRLSMGIQSFDNGELKTLGRIHTAEEALKSIGLVRDAGIRNLSLDLMYGIPGHTEDSWRQTLSAAVGQKPVHISAYELTLEEGTPLQRSMRKLADDPSLCHKPALQMPDEDKVLRMYEYCSGFLASHGYYHYEISNFALPGRHCRHNMNYWNRGEYLGIGAGAHSFLNKIRSENVRDISVYIDNLSRGMLPVAASMQVMHEDACREFIFLGLRTSTGISLNEAQTMGINLPCDLQELTAEGFLEVTCDSLRLTKKGRVISNSVIVRLFEILGL